MADEVARTCKCGCGTSIAGRRKNVDYVDHRHANQAYRARLKAELSALRLPANLSLAAARTLTATRNHPRDGRRGVSEPRGPMLSDIRVSYPRLVETYGEAEARRALTSAQLRKLDEIERKRAA